MKNGYWGDGTPTDRELGYDEQRGEGEDDGPRDVQTSYITLCPPSGRKFMVIWSWQRRDRENEVLDVELIIDGYRRRRDIFWGSLAPWIFNAMHDHMERQVRP